MPFVLILLGIAFAVLGTVALALRVHLFRHSILVAGRLVSVLEESRPFANTTGPRTEYRAVIAFNSTEGAEHRLKSTSTSFFRPRIGEHCPVRYACGNPEYARVATFFSFWLIPLSILGIGLALCALGLLGPRVGLY